MTLEYLPVVMIFTMLTLATQMRIERRRNNDIQTEIKNIYHVVRRFRNRTCDDICSDTCTATCGGAQMSQERYDLAMAKIKETQDSVDDSDVWFLTGLVDPLLDALRTVLKMHEPLYNPWDLEKIQGCGHGCGYERCDCEDCNPEGDYPCPTAALIIERILG